MAADEGSYAPHLFDPEPASAGPLPYPTQSRVEPTEVNLAGELRGYYGSDNFNPPASSFGKVRRNKDGTPRNHGGVDIYAPYIPFPHEIPVFAVCAGRVEFVYDSESPDDLGNRAWLYPANTQHDRVILGHLNRFVGHNRKVKKGDLLGFSGCSGNAGGTECTTHGVFNINSGHVHLAYRSSGADPVEPLGKLGWTLRFHEVVAPIALEKWEQDGHLLAEPVAPDFAPGTIATPISRGLEPRRKKEPPSNVATTGVRPRKLRELLETIDFDHQEAVAKTAAFYRLAHARLSEEEDEDEPKHPKAQFRQHGIAEFRKSVTAAGILRQRLLDIEKELHAISQEPSAPATLPARIRRAQMRTAEFLLDCMRLLWLAMAGEAMLPVTKHPGKIRDETGKWVPVPGGPWTGLVPRAGIGLWGRSIIVALGTGVGALQTSFLRKLVDDTANPGKQKSVPYSRWTLSASFGAGSSWHAILDERFRAEAGKLEAEDAALLGEYFLAVSECIYLMSALSSVTCQRSNIVDEGGLKSYLQSVRTMMGAIAGEGEESGPAVKLIDALQNIRPHDTTILALLTTIAKTSGDAAAQAAKGLEAKSKLERIRSAYDVIWVEPPS